MASVTTPQRRVLVSPEELIGYAIDGKYRLDSIIGGGGMGMVYRSTQQNLNRPVALKLLKLPEGDASKSLERFQREIDIVAQMSHPNIVRVFDSGIDPELGLHYIAMELIEGVGLERLIADWNFAPELTVEIARGICAALTEPHRLGIVHRDIKPGNILLTVRSDDMLGVKVVDFGISRANQVEQGQQVTATGEVIGSPQYMAPEAATGASIDARTDLYAVGVLLYEMLSGRPLFQGPTPISIMLRHLREAPPSLHELRPEQFLPIGSTPAALSTLVDTLLAKKPDDRPDSARKVLQELDSIRDVYGLHLPRLDGNTAALAALHPWLHARHERTQALGVQGNTIGPLPFFEGWLVPDTADFLAQTSPSEAETTGGDGAYAWQHAHTLSFGTKEEEEAAAALPESSAPDAAAQEQGSAAHDPDAHLNTGHFTGGPNGETTHYSKDPTKPDRAPLWLIGIALTALLITSVVVFLPGDKTPDTATSAEIGAPAQASSPIIPTHDAPPLNAPNHALAERDAASADAAAPRESKPEVDAPGLLADSAEQPAASAEQDVPAKQKISTGQKTPAHQKTPTKQNTPIKQKSQPSKDSEKLEEGLDWLRKR